MELETKVRTKTIIRRLPSQDVRAEIQKGNKFIIVQNDFDLNYIPIGYTLIDMKYKDNSFKTLVPQSLLFYMANPGEGDIDDALDEISGFYGEAKDFEDDMIENGETSVQGTNWATLARTSYDTYLINRLVKGKKRGRDENGEPIPEFNQDVLNQLDLFDPYVAQRLKAIAAVALGKNIDEVKKYDISDVLRHITIREDSIEELTVDEFKDVTCWAGSHYELKPEYKNLEGVEYRIEHKHNKSHMVGVKKTTLKEWEVFDAKIGGLEEEINNYRSQKRGNIGEHDPALLRQYANLAYITPENPKARLDISPPAKEESR